MGMSEKKKKKSGFFHGYESNSSPGKLPGWNGKVTKKVLTTAAPLFPFLLKNNRKAH